MSAAAFDDWDDEDDEGPSRTRIAVIAGAVVAALVLLWFVVVPALRDDGEQSVSLPSGTTETVPGPAGEPAATVESTTPSSSEPEVASTTTEAADPAGIVAETTVAAGTEPASTAVESSPAVPSSTPASLGGATYPTLPDGSPVPVLAIFDVDTITLSGTVPSEAAAERLKTLAIANSKTPAAVVEFLAIDPTVPMNVGVRVLELTSARFPEGSAEIEGAHAQELDRVVTVMNALPNTSVLVVGHADQRGNEAANYQISKDRAQAVVTYLASKGIDPSRLSSRAVGESDLVTLADDDAALALNRRTEFVFYGLLLPNT